ncbi:uncharacterized protein LOC134530689 isoform X1 [Bacillus rossius redtenbacheri]|uniref:uncharacterized protein LOC134530689 isoform X1 n=1 Tax=Bacillus rossius redtenbacheri TaxID=93214 RepID=UPI002FDE95CD
METRGRSRRVSQDSSRDSSVESTHSVDVSVPTSPSQVHNTDFVTPVTHAGAARVDVTPPQATTTPHIHLPLLPAAISNETSASLLIMLQSMWQEVKANHKQQQASLEKQSTRLQEQSTRLQEQSTRLEEQNARLEENLNSTKDSIKQQLEIIDSTLKSEMGEVKSSVAAISVRLAEHESYTDTQLQLIQQQCSSTTTRLATELNTQTSQLNDRLNQLAEQAAQNSCGLEQIQSTCQTMIENVVINHTTDMREHVDTLVKRQTEFSMDIEQQVGKLQEKVLQLRVDNLTRTSSHHVALAPALNTNANEILSSCDSPQVEQPELPITRSNPANTHTTLDPVAVMHHPARQWSEAMPRFSAHEGENPMRFIRRFEEYADMFRLSDTERLKCMATALRDHAYYWWEVLQSTITSYQEFKSHFKQQFWNVKIQGTLRARLHTERYDSKKNRTLETHLSQMFERTRYLEPEMGDIEFMAMVTSQLPIKYQVHLTGRSFNNITEFREQVLAFDRLERLSRNNNSEVEKDLKPAHQKAAPLYTPWQRGNDGGKANVHCTSWQPAKQYRTGKWKTRREFQPQHQGNRQPKKPYTHNQNQWWGKHYRPEDPNGRPPRWEYRSYSNRQPPNNMQQHMLHPPVADTAPVNQSPASFSTINHPPTTSYPMQRGYFARQQPIPPNCTVTQPQQTANCSYSQAVIEEHQNNYAQ